MSFYCGIDLGARESQICLINKRVKKVASKLGRGQGPPS